MRILWLNWRDRRHPKAGGAEVYTQEVARRLVERGHQVTLFVGTAPTLPSDEVVEGIKVMRRGGALSTRLHAWAWLRQHSDLFDVVLEEINTLPYVARLWSGRPVLVLIHQIAREVWWWEAPWFAAPVGWLLEPFMLKASRGPAVALSQSTRDDLVAQGYSPAELRVVHPGISLATAKPIDVEWQRGSFVYVGRITPSKRIDHAIRALGLLVSRGHSARLDVIGRGDDRVVHGLQGVASAEGVSDFVRFHHFVSDAERDQILASATAVVMTSAREGWGMSVTEANALGTPSVVYDRPGLRDSTRHLETGLITAPNVSSLADGMLRLIVEPGLRERLGAGARSWAAELTWEATTAAVEDALAALILGARNREGE